MRAQPKSSYLIVDSKNEVSAIMSIFEVIRLLREKKAHFYIEATRPDSIRVTATLVGERLEIECFQDHVEISRFYGTEAVEGGEDLLKTVLASV